MISSSDAESLVLRVRLHPCAERATVSVGMHARTKRKRERPRRACGAHVFRRTDRSRLACVFAEASGRRATDGDEGALEDERNACPLGEAWSVARCDPRSLSYRPMRACVHCARACCCARPSRGASPAARPILRSSAWRPSARTACDASTERRSGRRLAALRRSRFVGASRVRKGAPPGGKASRAITDGSTMAPLGIAECHSDRIADGSLSVARADVHGADEIRRPHRTEPERRTPNRRPPPLRRLRRRCPRRSPGASSVAPCRRRHAEARSGAARFSFDRPLRACAMMTRTHGARLRRRCVRRGRAADALPRLCAVALDQEGGGERCMLNALHDDVALRLVDLVPECADLRRRGRHRSVRAPRRTSGTRHP